LCDKFETEGTVKKKGCSGRPDGLNDDGSVDCVTGHHKISEEVCKAMLCENGVCKTSVQCNLWSKEMKPWKIDRAKRKCSVSTPISRLNTLHFYLWGDLKNTVYDRKPSRLQDLRHEIAIACAAIPPAIIQEVCHSVTCHKNVLGLVVDI
jgi:hypothetical protein